MLRAYKYRLYPNVEQKVLLSKHFGCVRWVWNWALAERTKVYEATKKMVSKYELCKRLPVMKKQEATEWLGEVNAQSLQGALHNLDEAYTKFFREKKGFPKFKSKHNYQSFQCPQGSDVDFKAGSISIVKLPSIRAKTSREFKGKIKTVSISMTPTGKYFASVLVDDGKPEPEQKKRINSSKTVGVDVGITHFATLSTGEKVENPKYLTRALRKLRRAQRRQARRVKGSKNRQKARHQVALIHERVTNRRNDFQHKLSTRLIRENQAVCLETLNIAGMQKNTRRARAISDAAWGQFVTMLEYKARWQGKTVLRIGQFEPSSKLCSCGVINQELKLSDRTWKCGSCGIKHDRDILAANNIKRMALHPGNFLAQGMREFTPVETGSSRSLKQELA